MCNVHISARPTLPVNGGSVVQQGRGVGKEEKMCGGCSAATALSAATAALLNRSSTPAPSSARTALVDARRLQRRHRALGCHSSPAQPQQHASLSVSACCAGECAAATASPPRPRLPQQPSSLAAKRRRRRRGEPCRSAAARLACDRARPNISAGNIFVVAG